MRSGLLLQAFACLARMTDQASSILPMVVGKTGIGRDLLKNTESGDRGGNAGRGDHLPSWHGWVAGGKGKGTLGETGTELDCQVRDSISPVGNTTGRHGKGTINFQSRNSSNLEGRHNGGRENEFPNFPPPPLTDFQREELEQEIR